MKLVRLYANKNFHNIKFQTTGLNVVLGCITNKNINTKDTHNLGKTLLCDVIDFMMLKQVKKDFFLKKYTVFSDCYFFLEILLDNQSYLVVRRSVNDPNKICFRNSTISLEDFDIGIDEWDYEDLPFSEAVTQFNKYLNFSIATDISYRKYIDYFLRHQADYLDVFHLSKYKGKASSWKEFLIELFGYDNHLIKEKQEIDEEIDEKKAERTYLKNRTSENENKDSLKALIELKEQELKERKQLIDEIDFSEEDTKEHKVLIERIDAQLQIQNTRFYELRRDIERISNSLNTEIKQVDINELKEVFEDAKISFPNEVYIQFNDLVEFNRKISNERNEYLQRQLQEMKNELPKVNDSINELQRDRKKSLAFLTETNSYEKYKEIQSRISEIESQINSLKIQYDKISGYQSEIQLINEQIATLNVKRANIISDTEKMLQEGKHAQIRNIFNSIIKDILNVNGIISLNLNNNGNIDFEAKIQNPKTLDVTSKDNGSSYRKLLCMAFDISLLINYHSESFFKFTYHDGALEALDDRKKILFLNKSRKICKDFGLQHIITIIDSDLPYNPDGTLFELKEEEICLTLSDKNSEDKLFTIEF